MAYIVVEKWDKENEGKQFALGQNLTLIGRPSSTNHPDIPINDLWVSRSHIEISNNQGNFEVRDVGSDNGTQINGQAIESGKVYPLEHNFTIGLAILAGKPRIILRFWDSEDITMAGSSEFCNINPVNWLKIDEDRKEVWVDGRLISVSKKEYCLIHYLYRKAGRKCSKDEIIAEVWTEVIDPGAVSDAAVETLIHRLRHKVEPDPANPKRLISRKGFGYMLLSET